MIICPRRICIFHNLSHSVKAAWNRGTMLAEGQNLAKRLMEAPANVMTPTQFTWIAKEKMSGLDKVQVRVRFVKIDFKEYLIEI